MMRKIVYFIMALCLCGHVRGMAQDAYLKKLADDVLNMRKSKASNQVLNQAVVDWSAKDCPKITLMDDVGFDKANESRGSGVNKFRLNQLVTYVYSRQNTAMVSKGDYFNSTEKDIHYSAIEKTVKKGCTVTYTLTGHIGVQEFALISFNPKATFSATVNGKKATQTGDGVMWLNLGKVSMQDKIVLSITNSSPSDESFVIFNHNPQK